MKKRGFTHTLAIVMALTVTAAAIPANAAGGFTDVQPEDWHYEYVALCAERGLINGRGDGTFDPDALLTRGEAERLAAAIGGDDVDGSGAAAGGGDELATRAYFAELIHRAAGNTEAINAVRVIRDAAEGESWTEAVYALYRAGILTGGDRYGSFFPHDTITRAEAAAVMARVAEPELRSRFETPERLTAENIYTLCAGAAFTITTYDASYEVIREGSGFFISPGGVAVTNLHVIDTAYTATARTSDGKVYRVAGARAWNRETNIAVLQIEGEGFDYLPVADSTPVRAGAEAYSLGSPLGLEGSIAGGVVSFAGRETQEQVMMQFTPAISQGSGGGALLDSLGRVIGVTSSSYNYGSMLNFAVPSKHSLELELASRVMPIDRV
jgi:S1-C subfamily serine protease